MDSSLKRRQFLKALGLATCGSMFSRWAAASEKDWVLGFGSCMDTRRSQSFWSAVNGRSYNHFAFLGDNLYPVRDSLPELQNAYERLALSEGLATLRSKVGVSAIWDDHDFGADNADSSLPYRAESHVLFKEFWKHELATSDDGVYSSQMFEHEGRKVHLILLDARFNRTPYSPAGVISGGVSTPLHGTAVEPILLGQRQWQWLDEQLAAPADLKILGSSIQVLSSDHRFEKWANYPREYERLLQTLGRISAPTLLLSGDRHLHEISRTQLVSGRTLYDFTSSGFNKADGLSRFEKNRIRVERNLDDGFGEVRVKWVDGVPYVTLSMVDRTGQIRFSQSDFLV